MLDFQCKSEYDISDFRALIKLLRQKDGCPWDSVQTHHSIRNNFIEETYEACEAIDTEDTALLKEELGDVLMQVIFHASIEEDLGHFDLDDVADAACKKLIFRHPKLFPREDGIGLTWDELKKQEKGFSSYSDSLDAVARSLPALWRAQKIQKRASSCGFEWHDYKDPLSKIREETAELETAVEADTNIEEEIGDLLFSVVALSRVVKTDPEEALHKACEKFISRFRRMEAYCSQDLSSLSEAELLDLWKTVKSSERS